VSAVAGTGPLLGVAIRRDRLVAAASVATFALIAGYSARATIDLYPTTASRVSASESINRSRALVALYGRIAEPSSVGALSVVKTASMGAVFVALLAIVLVVRHTRADEERGLAELVGAGATGREAPLVAAFAVVAVTAAALAVCSAAALVAADLPSSGSLAFGLAVGGVALVFGSIAAIAAQVATTGRAAIALSAAVLGTSFVLRAVGDTVGAGGRWAVWLSPLGWVGEVRAYDGDRWWVLGIMVAFAATCAGVAWRLRAGRDLGAGLLAVRPGAAAASPRLRSAGALAWRLHRTSLAGWAVGFAGLGVLAGSLASSVGDFVNTSSSRDFIEKLGGRHGLTDAYLATELGVAAVVAAAYGIQAVLRLRTEEASGRAEPLLAASLSRVRWAAGHFVVAYAGVAALLAVVGAAAGAADAIATGDAGDGWRVLGAAVAQVPAAWVVVGIAVALVGLAPRQAPASWAALAAFVLLGEFGPLFGVPRAVMDLSPFTHVAHLPGGTLRVPPVVALLAVAGGLSAAGLVGLRRRDLD
jgi:ABC-2 type transport system permease protein